MNLVLVFNVCLGRVVMGLGNGALNCSLNDRHYGYSLQMRLLDGISGLRDLWWSPRAVLDSLGTFVFLPLWILAAALGLPGLYLWHSARSRPEHRGLCETCGYNLHGLSTNRCPECGTSFGYTGTVKRDL